MSLCSAFITPQNIFDRFFSVLHVFIFCIFKTQAHCHASCLFLYFCLPAKQPRFVKCCTWINNHSSSVTVALVFLPNQRLSCFPSSMRNQTKMLILYFQGIFIPVIIVFVNSSQLWSQTLTDPVTVFRLNKIYYLDK